MKTTPRTCSNCQHNPQDHYGFHTKSLCHVPFCKCPDFDCTAVNQFDHVKILVEALEKIEKSMTEHTVGGPEDCTQMERDLLAHVGRSSITAKDALSDYRRAGGEMITREEIQQGDGHKYCPPPYGFKCGQCGVNWSRLILERDKVVKWKEAYQSLGVSYCMDLNKNLTAEEAFNKIEELAKRFVEGK